MLKPVCIGTVHSFDLHLKISFSCQIISDQDGIPHYSPRTRFVFRVPRNDALEQLFPPDHSKRNTQKQPPTLKPQRKCGFTSINDLVSEFEGQTQEFRNDIIFVLFLRFFQLDIMNPMRKLWVIYIFHFEKYQYSTR